MSSIKDSYNEVHHKMKKVINTINCLPDWETMVEYEFIRQEGKYNMFAFTSNEVQRHAYNCGLYHYVNWIEQIKTLKINIFSALGKAYVHYESIHGPRENWITKEYREKVKQTIKENMIHQLKEELYRLEHDD